MRPLVRIWVVSCINNLCRGSVRGARELSMIIENKLQVEVRKPIEQKRYRNVRAK